MESTEKTEKAGKAQRPTIVHIGYNGTMVWTVLVDG
jgi:hypothetical protein